MTDSIYVKVHEYLDFYIHFIREDPIVKRGISSIHSLPSLRGFQERSVILAAVGRIIFEVCFTLCAKVCTFKTLCGKADEIFCVCVHVSLSLSQTHAVIQPSHELRFLAKPWGPGPARLVSVSRIWWMDVGCPQCCSKQRESLKVKSESASRLGSVWLFLWPQRVCNAGSLARGILQTRILESG